MLAALRKSIVAIGQRESHRKQYCRTYIVSGIGPPFGEPSQVGRPESGGHLYFTFNIPQQDRDRETVIGLRVTEGRIHKDKATVMGGGKEQL